MQQKNKLRVFLDSNVIYSGLYYSGSTPALILKHCIEGKFRAVISTLLLEEVLRTIRRKLPLSIQDLRKFIVSVPWEIVKDPSMEEIAKWSRVIHIEDAVIVAAAIASESNILVTGDKDFFNNTDIFRKSGLQIITPAQFLKMLERK